MDGCDILAPLSATPDHSNSLEFVSRFAFSGSDLATHNNKDQDDVAMQADCTAAVTNVDDAVMDRIGTRWDSTNTEMVKDMDDDQPSVIVQPKHLADANEESARLNDGDDGDDDDCNDDSFESSMCFDVVSASASSSHCQLAELDHDRRPEELVSGPLHGSSTVMETANSGEVRNDARSDLVKNPTSSPADPLSSGDHETMTTDAVGVDKFHDDWLERGHRLLSQDKHADSSEMFSANTDRAVSESNQNFEIMNKIVADLKQSEATDYDNIDQLSVEPLLNCFLPTSVADEQTDYAVLDFVKLDGHAADDVTVTVVQTDARLAERDDDHGKMNVEPTVTTINTNSNVVPSSETPSNRTAVWNVPQSMMITPTYKPRASPYHRVYSPLSATPNGCSPAFKTPIQAVGRAANHATPSSHLTPSNKRVTPQSQVYNPFEAGMLERLHLPVFSPTVFTKISTPGSSDSKDFQWSIENAAILHPADIDETSYQSPFTLLKDKDTEARVQRAIRHYFTSNLIAPSPYQPPQPHKLPATPAHAYPDGMDMGSPDTTDYPPDHTRPKTTQDVVCQTVLTLPTNFDLAKYLGDYMTYRAEDDAPQEVLNTSTLRRKLFFQGDTSGLPSPSPVKHTPEVEMERDMWMNNTSNNRPVSDHFSSSPISITRSGSFPRASTEHIPISADLFTVKPSHAMPDFQKADCSSFLMTPPPVSSHPQGRSHRSHSCSPRMPTYEQLRTAQCTPDLSPINSSQHNRGNFPCDASPIRYDPVTFRSRTSCGLSPSRLRNTSPNNSHRLPPRHVPFTPDVSPIPSDTSMKPPHHARITAPSSHIFHTSVSPISSTSGMFAPMSPIITPQMSSARLSQSQSASPVLASKNLSAPTIHTDRLSANSPPLLPLSDYLDFSPSGVSTPDKRKERSHATNSSTTPTSQNSLPHPTSLSSDAGNSSSVFMELEPRSGQFASTSPRQFTEMTAHDSAATFDLSLSVDVSDHDCGQSSNQVSQDTGYQTSSLQSTNHHQTSSLQLTGVQEPVQHSNLTSHFTGLPFRSFIETDATDSNTQKPSLLNMDATKPTTSSNNPPNEPKSTASSMALQKRVVPINNIVQSGGTLSSGYFPLKSKYPMIDRIIHFDNKDILTMDASSLCDGQSFYRGSVVPDANLPFCADFQQKPSGFDQYRKFNTSPLADMQTIFSEHDDNVITRAHQVLKKVGGKSPVELKSAAKYDFSNNHKVAEISVRSSWPPAAHPKPEVVAPTASMVVSAAIQSASRELMMFDRVVSSQTTPTPSI